MKRIIKNTISLASVALMALTMSACSITRESSMARHVYDVHSIVDDYPGRNFSDPMQLLYSIYWAEPDRSNNIDNFNIFNYTNPNATQNVLQAASISNALAFGNPLQALTYGTLAQINKTSPNSFYRQNLLILMMPLSGEPGGEASAFQKSISDDVDSLHRQSMEIIKSAYLQDDVSIAFDVEDLEFRSRVVSYNKPHYLIPDGLSYCPEAVTSLSDLNDSQLEYCAVLLRNYGSGFTNNTSVKLAPQGNFVSLVTRLPDMFPVENLNTDSDFSFVYVPTFLYRLSDVADNMSGEELVKYYDKGSFSLNPYMKNIKTGEVMYFNSQLQALQKDKFEVIDEKKVIVNAQ